MSHEALFEQVLSLVRCDEQLLDAQREQQKPFWVSAGLRLAAAERFPDLDGALVQAGRDHLSLRSAASGFVCAVRWDPRAGAMVLLHCIQGTTLAGVPLKVPSRPE